MTDVKRSLKQLAEMLVLYEHSPSISAVYKNDFKAAANPQAVLGLIARIDELSARCAKLEAALKSISNHASDPFAWWVREAREALTTNVDENRSES